MSSTSLTNLQSTIMSQVLLNPASKQQVGQDYNPISNTSTITKLLKLNTTSAPNATGGANVVLSTIVVLTGGASTDFDLSNFTDILGQSVTDAVRAKYFQYRLLSPSDDATNGTGAVSVLVGQNNSTATGSGYIFQGFNKGLTDTQRVYNGGFLAFGVANGAGVPISTATAGGHIVRITNESLATQAAVQITMIGGDV